MNFWSHSSISVVLRRLSSSSPAEGGSFLWCSHHSMTLRRTASLTCEVLAYLRSVLARDPYGSGFGSVLALGNHWMLALTFGMGMASPESPRSSSIFLIRTDHSATVRSAWVGKWPRENCESDYLHTNGDIHAIRAGEGDLRSSHCENEKYAE
jgi:hypothetical protein